MRSEDSQTEMAPPLPPPHAALLEASKISSGVAQARGYRSVTTEADMRLYGVRLSLQGRAARTTEA